MGRKKKGKLAYTNWKKLVLNILVTRKESLCRNVSCPFKQSTKFQRPEVGRVGRKPL